MPELDPDTIAHLPFRSTLDGRSYVARLERGETDERSREAGGHGR